MEFNNWASAIPAEELGRIIFGGLAEMHSLQHHFGDIGNLIHPQVKYVETYSDGKMLSLLREKAVCEIQDPREREEHHQISVRKIVRSFYREKLTRNTAIVFNLAAYRKLKQRKKGLPRIHEGIGTCFLKHIGHYNNILRILLRQNAWELLSLFESVSLEKEEKFIDLFVGQSVYTSFMAWSERLPSMKYRRLA